MSTLNKVRVQLLNQNTGAVEQEVDVLTSADAVTFNDGETFQQKLDAGKLKGAKGDTGATGPQGIQGPKGDTGAAGPQGAKGDTGATGATGAKGATGTRGSVWYSGTAITGTSTTATIFSGSGISALVNDRYFNTSTGNVYKCTVAGNASTAKWVYEVCLKGAKGDTGATGATGAKGATGATGATGAQGPKGDKGDPGDTVKVGTSYASGTEVKLFFKVV